MSKKTYKMSNVNKTKLNKVKLFVQRRGLKKTISSLLMLGSIGVRVQFKKFFRLGSLPDFLIIGAMKSGTTSLHNYLCEHPDIVSGIRKEVHYFDRKYDKGLNWYKAHFPNTLQKGKITGESTPRYIFASSGAQRTHQLLPSVKSILLLRNPVDRAFSHYNANKKKLIARFFSFEDAVNFEKEAESEQGLEKIMAGHDNRESVHYPYLVRSRYAEQVERWLNYFDKEQLLIIKSEDLYADPQKECSKVFQFLGLSDHKITPKVYNKGKYKEQMKPETREQLKKYFKPFNQKLYKLIGRDMGWD